MSDIADRIVDFCEIHNLLDFAFGEKWFSNLIRKHGDIACIDGRKTGKMSWVGIGLHKGGRTTESGKPLLQQ